MRKIIIMILLISLFGCGEKLNLKPDNSIVLPKTIKDFETLLDNKDLILTTALPQISADEYFIPTLQLWQSLTSVTARNASIWQREIYEGETKIADWTFLYQSVFYANNAIENIKESEVNNVADVNRIKGWALFIRSYAFYSLVSTFSKGYDKATAQTDLGIPLKLNAGIDEVVQRSSVQQVYDRIIEDATEASNLLQQDIIPTKRSRPSKIAAFAFLARVYLSMREYEKAEQFADKTLTAYSELIDFNTLNKAAASPFSVNGLETIYFTRIVFAYPEIAYSWLNTSYGISPELLNLYNSADLRTQLYFQKNTLGNFNTKPINTAGSSVPFTGIATDEVYLMKAECLARRGETNGAMEYLNQLYIKRWDKSIPYQKLTATSPETALNEVLKERRRALVWRSLRWTDLKRLNLEGRNITITRKLDDQTYVLPPNSPKYVMPIPDDEIVLSGIQQNLR